WKTDYRYFDQYSLKEMNVNHVFGRLKDQKFADKAIRMNYDLHTGAIIGLPGKIIAFIASLIIAILPVTGFMIWYGRRKKERKVAGV
ncbi:MAG TPA: PepSY-associated TM helix domain-containing protein, partial [Daejeonella sp.]|nr:PepSY-associated TM helix domain-containing protein [Daejeonella sp.]